MEVEICLTTNILETKQAGGSLFSICILLDFPESGTLPHYLSSVMCGVSEFQV